MLKWKYLRGTPLNRVLQDLELQGVHLSAGTVTGGLQLIDKLLTPLYQDMRSRCRRADLWNADETTWRVYEDKNGQRSKKRWWFWLLASCDAIVYLLDKSRSKEVPADFFSGSSGVLMTDRLASYKNLNDRIEKAWCWVHQRRDFLKVFDGVPQLKDWASQWLEEIQTLFSLNHKRIKLWQTGLCATPQWDAAQLALEQHIDKLAQTAKKQLQSEELHKLQKKILHSMQKHWDGLTLFLTDPRIPLDNNRAERLLRPLVVNRKNTYGSGTEWSGQLAAKLFTVFQTWLVNGLNPETLLLDYLNECSKQPGRPPPDISGFLPWTMSGERKQLFLAPNNIKLPA
jgi:transposase